MTAPPPRPDRPRPTDKQPVNIEAAYRTRPRGRTVIAVGQLLSGIVLVVVNYSEELGFHLLPGGHNEGYFFLGILIGAGSLYWFGAFDRRG